MESDGTMTADAAYDAGKDTRKWQIWLVGRIHRCKLPQLAAVMTAIMGVIALAGWSFSSPLLKSVLPGAVEMKANTAVGLILSACALFILGNGPTRFQQYVAQAVALMVALLGLATLGEYLFGWQLGIDELLFSDSAGVYESFSGRMSPYSAVTFSMIGLGLAVLPWRALRPPAYLLSILVMAIGAVSFLGYLWNAAEIVTDQILPPVAVNTAVAFALLGGGMFHLSWTGKPKHTTRTPFENRILAGFISAFVLLLVVGGYTYRSNAAYVESSHWVSHTQEVRAVLGELYSAISDVESVQRSYLLTGNISYKKKYAQLTGVVGDVNEGLARLVADNPVQMVNLIKLDQLIERRIDSLEKHLAVFEHQGLAAAKGSITHDDGITTMQQIHTLIARMGEIEEQLLVKREASLAHDRTVTLVALVGMLVVAISILTMLFWGIRRENMARTEAEQQLRINEENLAITLNSIGDAVMATDTAGQITRMNAVAEQLTGWTLAEVAGKPIADVFHIINQHTREPAVIPVNAVLEQGVIHDLANDTVLVSRDGNERPIADSCAPIRSRDGEMIGAVLVFRDVSREYAAQAALRDSATRMQTILNTVGDGIVSNNEQGIIESFNPAAERIFGYDASEVIGANVGMLMAEQDLLRHSGDFRDDIGIRREVGGRRKDGSEFPLELTVSEMHLDGQRLFTAIIRDITERKEAENQLDLFFSLSLDMLCISSADGYFKRISPAFTHVLGWSIEEILARPFLDFVHPDDHAATLREVERQVASGEKVLSFENRYLHKDGSWRILSWKSVPHGDGLMFATARDVTARKQMEQTLIRSKEKAELANRAKDSFLATMSHEIRTPLTGMLGMLELLSMTELDGDQRRTLDTAWESARGLLRIVNDILDWSKIEEGKLELSLRATSIPQLLQEVVNTYSRVASAKNLVLWQHADARLSQTHIVDPLRLSQVLHNFISNAIKFTQKGEIELRADLLEQIESGERIRFSVRDTGVGIPEEIQPYLFQRYRQGSADTARMYGGTGLGLSICQRLAQMMDGRIALESEPGRGSIFSLILILPVSGAPAETLPAMHPEVERRSVKPLFSNSENAPCVLAVDDHPINRDLLARQIRLLGLKAETAESGQTALSKWREGHFSMVITDCHMPEMDGYSLTRSIRKIEAREKSPRIPILAWTANALAEESVLCSEAGMDELLVKPANIAQLREMLAKWLNIEDTDNGLPASVSLQNGKEVARQSGPIDFAELEKVVPDKAEHAAVLQDFLAQIRMDLPTLTGALQRGDQVTAERMAHRIKGSSRMVGATGMAQTCAGIEQAARVGDIAAARAAGKILNEVFVQCERFIFGLEGGQADGSQ